MRSCELETGEYNAYILPTPLSKPSWHMAPFHVYLTPYHAKGQTEGTILTLCTVLLCNLPMQLTPVSILQVSAVLSVLQRAKV